MTLAVLPTGTGKINVGINRAIANYNLDVGGTINATYIIANTTLSVGTTSATYPVTILTGAATPLAGLAGALAVAEGNINNYTQFNIRNGSNGSGASSDYIVTADDGSDTANYLDLGINNSNYNAPSSWTINGPRDGYLYMNDSNLSIGSANSTARYKYVNFFLGGSLIANEVLRLQDSATGGGSDRYLSEDYMFCQLWRKLGGTIYLCPWMRTQHIGTYHFHGDMPSVANYVGEM